MNNETRLIFSGLTKRSPIDLDSLDIKDENDAYAIIRGCHDYVDELREFQATEIEVAPNSRMGRVDALHPPHLASHHVTRSIVGTTDHLLTLRHLLGTARAQTIMGPFTLLRGAYEATSQGLYVMGNRNAKEMSLRTLRLEVSDDSNARKFGREMDSESWSIGRLESIKESVAKTEHSWGDVREALPYTTILRTCGEEFGLENTMLIYWMLSSGTAHNKAWAAVVLSDMRELEGTRTDIGATYHLTSNTEHIAGAYRLACYAADMLVNAYSCQAQGLPHNANVAFGQSVYNLGTFVDKYRD